MRRGCKAAVLLAAVLLMVCGGAGRAEWDTGQWETDSVLTIRSQEEMDAYAAYETYLVENKLDETRIKNFHTLIIGKGVRSIPNYAFEACEKLKRVELPDGLESIGACAFMCCTNLEEMKLPESVREMGYRTFAFCSTLQRVELPPGLTRVEECLFEDCESLFEITVPANIKVLAYGAFDSRGLQRVIFEGTVETIEKLYSMDTPDLTQMVFLAGPPATYRPTNMYSEWDGMSLDPETVTVYYDKKNAALWSPNGETTWAGCRLVGIDTLDDLPPLLPREKLSLAETPAPWPAVTPAPEPTATPTPVLTPLSTLRPSSEPTATPTSLLTPLSTLRPSSEPSATSAPAPAVPPPETDGANPLVIGLFAAAILGAAAAAILVYRRGRTSR